MKILIHSDYKNICFSSDKIKTIITDPPFGITSNEWDKEMVDFIEHFLPIVSKDFTFVTCADIKYASFLLNKHKNIFSHDIIWKKTIGSGQLNINKQPLRLHELVLVFRGNKTYYNRMKSPGEPYSIKRDIKTEQCYGKQKEHVVVNTGERDLNSVWEIPNPRVKNGHPTQKPIQLFQKLADVYSEKNDIILDPFGGSGISLDIDGRYVIVIEKDRRYYELARDNRKNRILEEKFRIGNEFQEFISNLSDFEHTIFSS